MIRMLTKPLVIPLDYEKAKQLLGALSGSLKANHLLGKAFASFPKEIFLSLFAQRKENTKC